MTYGAFAVLIVLIRSPGSHVLTVLLGLSRGGKAPAMVGSAYAQIGFYSWKELLRVATERVRCCIAVRRTASTSWSVSAHGAGVRSLNGKGVKGTVE